SSCRCCMQQIAGATRQHAGEYRPRGVDMGHHVHIPNLLPLVVRDFRTTNHAKDSSVGAEEINGPVCFDCLSDEVNDLCLVGDICRDGQPIYLLGHTCGGFAIEVSHHHPARAFSRKATTESPPDAVRAASYDYNFV